MRKENADKMRSRALSAGVEVEKHETVELEPRQRQLAGSSSVEEIRQRAYEIHLEHGGVHGRDQDDWLQAERELGKTNPTS
jgi:hypothetical protein